MVAVQKSQQHEHVITFDTPMMIKGIGHPTQQMRGNRVVLSRRHRAECWSSSVHFWYSSDGHKTQRLQR